MKLDFRTKFILTIVLGIVVVEGSVSQKYPFLGILLVVFPYILALFDREKSLFFKGLFYTVIALLGQKFLPHFQENFLAMVLTLYCGIILRIIPGVMMGYYGVTTTRMSDLVYSLTRMKFPDFIIIPISVMFRFFYSIKEDYKVINEAMYMHGLTLKNFFKNPARIIEYKFVPLLMITSQTADNVSISAMTRGMRVGEERSSISNASLKFYDYILILFSLFLTILFIKVKLC